MSRWSENGNGKKHETCEPDLRAQEGKHASPGGKDAGDEKNEGAICSRQRTAACLGRSSADEAGRPLSDIDEHHIGKRNLPTIVHCESG